MKLTLLRIYSHTTSAWQQSSFVNILGVGLRFQPLRALPRSLKVQGVYQSPVSDEASMARALLSINCRVS